MSQAQITYDAVKDAVLHLEQHGLCDIAQVMGKGILPMMVHRGNLLHSPLPIEVRTLDKEKYLIDGALRYGALLTGMILRHGDEAFLESINAHTLVRNALNSLAAEAFPRAAFVQAARFFIQHYADIGPHAERIANELKRIHHERLGADRLFRDISIDDALAFL